MYLGEAPKTDTTPAWLTQVLDLGKGALALRQQADIQRINTQRLQQGLPPIDASDVAVGAKVAMDTKQLNKILLVSAAMLGAVLLVMVTTRRRK